MSTQNVVLAFKVPASTGDQLGASYQETSGTNPLPVTGTVTQAALPLTPAAAPINQITTGGTAVVAISGPINGGFIQNPLTAAAQGIGAAESLFINLVGSAGTVGNGTTSELFAGSTFTLPALAAGVNVSVNGATAGHKFAATKW